MPPSFMKIVAVSLAAVTFALACMTYILCRSNCDISVLTCTGSGRVGHGPYRAVTWKRSGPLGYDGQYYYAIAQAPWRIHDKDEIDCAAARHLRVLYPAVCWLLSGGDPVLLLWVMPAVNLLVFGALAGLGAYLALSRGWSQWWGLTLPLTIHALLPVLRDLTDSLSVLMVCVLLVCWLFRDGQRSARALCWSTLLLGLFATAAMLCREQNLLLVGVLFLAAAWRRDRLAIAALAASIAVWLGWVGWLWVGYGEKPFLPGPDNFQAPLDGLVWRWQHVVGNEIALRVVVLKWVSLVHFTLLLGLGAYLVCRSGSRVLRLSLCLGIALALLGGPALYGDMWSYSRVFVWIPLGIWMLAMQSGNRWQMAALLPGCVSSFCATMRYI